MNLLKISILIASTLVLCPMARSQTPPPAAPMPTPFATNPCKTPEGHNRGVDDWIICGKSIYDKFTSKDGFRMVLGSVAPGSGLTAGVGFGHRTNGPNWQTRFDSSARVSINKYWELDTNLRLTKTSSSTTASPDLGNLKINIYGLVKDMRAWTSLDWDPKAENRIAPSFIIARV